MKNSKIKMIIILVALVVVAGLATWYYFNSTRSSIKTSDGINYQPATEQDSTYNDSIKKSIASDQENNNSSSSSKDSKSKVSPVITAWGQPGGAGTDLSVNGYIQGATESDGTCTLTLNPDQQNVIVTKKALQNAQSTSCGQMTVPFSQLSRGTWTAVLSYSSNESYGTSQPVTIEVK